MRKNLAGIYILVCFLVIGGCTSKKETPESIARHWCELNAKAYNAPEGPSKEAATAARKKFETDMTAMYKDDTDFMEAVGKEVQKCEDASEGK